VVISFSSYGYDKKPLPFGRVVRGWLCLIDMLDTYCIFVKYKIYHLLAIKCLYPVTGIFKCFIGKNWTIKNPLSRVYLGVCGLTMIIYFINAFISFLEMD